jgi:hypothetical protein
MKRNFLLFFIFVVIIGGCNNSTNNKEDYTIDLETISDGEMIELKTVPNNIQQWIDFYHQYDTSFTLFNFKASGVVLHLDEMKQLDSLTEINKKLYSLLSFSPDNKKYVDLWSFGNEIPPTDFKTASQQRSLNDGEADQQIVLGEVGGKRRELMFNGPAQIVEAADWINNDQFLISMFSEEKNEMVVEIYLFDLKKEVFTNYRLSHNFKISLKPQKSFSDFWLESHKSNIDKR